jgi:hypothetical protein
MRQRVSFGSWLAVAVPFAIFVAHASLFGSWIIDDAAIGFTYARNLADGHGLVAQAGAEPVEGFSDFLWVILFVPCFWADVFHPVITPKILSALLVLLTFVVVRRCLRRYTGAGDVVVGLTLTLVALNSSFVVWTISGLENPLYVLLTVLLLWRGLVITTETSWTMREAVLCGLLATATALTRPDGIVYVCAAPGIAIASWLADRKKQPMARFLAGYTCSVLLLLGSFLLFRYSYFHDWFPNTYHAKGASPAGTLHDMGIVGMIRKVNSLLNSVLVVRAVLVGALGLLAWLAVRRKQIRRPHLVWLFFLALSVGVFLLLPLDWMPLFRFATPFPVFFLGFWVSLAGACLRSVDWTGGVRLVVGGLVTAAALTGTLIQQAQETAAFRVQPPVPFQFVAEVYGERFNRYAAQLGVNDGSILVPDLGGTLTCSKLRVVDLAGLCDRTIGRTLGRDRSAMYDYIFEAVRPTFIHTHKNWAWDANLEADPRFRRDYVALHEVVDPWIGERFHMRRHAGDYVRRDAIRGRDAAFAAVKEDCRRLWCDFLYGPPARRLYADVGDQLFRCNMTGSPSLSEAASFSITSSSPVKSTQRDSPPGWLDSTCFLSSSTRLPSRTPTLTMVRLALPLSTVKQ